MASGSPAGLDRKAAWELCNGELVLFGITIAKALQRQTDFSEYLDVGELFSGVGHIVKAARQNGCNAQGFDLKRSPGETDSRGGSASEDITCEPGFNNALDLVLRIRQGGLLILAVDCSSFTFPNSNKTRRTHGHEHGADYYAATLGNCMAMAAAFLMNVAIARGVHVLVENPPDSHLFKFWQQMCPEMLEGLTKQSVARCAFDALPDEICF